MPEPNVKPRKKNHNGPRTQFCTFLLEGRLYGVNILEVKEVNPETQFTAIAHAPDEIKGYVNIRGNIYLILDLRLLLGLPRIQVGEKSRLVLFKPATGESFGVLVDAIGDVVEVENELIQTGGLVGDELSDVEGVDPHGLVSGVCRLEQSLLLVVKAKKLLKALDH